MHAAGMAVLTGILKMFWRGVSVAGLFLVTFPYFSVLNGYTAARFYLFFNGAQWMTLAVLATLFYPFALFACYLVVDLVDPAFSSALFGEDSISANTFAYLWMFVSLPGSAIGTYNGFISERPSIPTKQSRLLREVPAQSRVSSFQRMVSASLLPFIAIYLQFAFFSASEYSVNGLHVPKMNLVQTAEAGKDLADFDTSQWGAVLFSSICALIYLVIVAEISVVQTYLQLCEEDYRWQWRSFKNGGSPAIFLFFLSFVVKLVFG